MNAMLKTFLQQSNPSSCVTIVIVIQQTSYCVIISSKNALFDEIAK